MLNKFETRQISDNTLKTLSLFSIIGSIQVGGWGGGRGGGGINFNTSYFMKCHTNVVFFSIKNF